MSYAVTNKFIKWTIIPIVDRPIPKSHKRMFPKVKHTLKFLISEGFQIGYSINVSFDPNNLRYKVAPKEIVIRQLGNSVWGIWRTK